MALSARKREPGIYHVTEILNPPQVVYLSRNEEFFTDPTAMIWSMLGSGVHGVLEDAGKSLGERYSIERNFIVDFGFASLSGTPDVFDNETKTIVDYKTIKSYAAKKLKSGDFGGNKYKDQLNIYAAYGFPEAEHLVIEAIVKDWTRAMYLKDGLMPIEDIVVPLEPRGKTEEMTQRLLQEHVRAQETGQYRECSCEEIWISQNPRSPDFGMPLRCRDYCGVNASCKQWREFLESTKG